MLQPFFPGSVVLSLPSALSQTSHQSCCHWLCDFFQKTMAAGATDYSIRKVLVCQLCSLLSTPFVALACEVSLTVCSALGFSSRKATGCLSPQTSHSSTLQNPALCACVYSLKLSVPSEQKWSSALEHRNTPSRFQSAIRIYTKELSLE